MTIRQKKKVKFVADYRGEFSQTIRKKGSVHEFQKVYADWFIENGWAVDAEIEATEVAIALALENELPLGSVVGSGADGRVLKSDVEQALEDRDGN